MENCKAILQQSECDLPHAVHVRRVDSATQPRIEAFLWCLSIDIVCAEKKAETEWGEMSSWHREEEYSAIIRFNKCQR